MKKQLFFFLPILFIVNCDLFETEENEENNLDYPTIIYPITETELNGLQSKLDSLLGTKYQAELDEYGLIDWAGLLSRGSSSIDDINDAISKAKLATIAFTEFTNVTDTSLLVVDKATNIHGTDLFNDWIVSFENQTYDDIEVLNTAIMVLITDNITQISGHCYKEIFVPIEDRISLEDVGKSLIGMELVYYGFADLDTFIVTEDALYINGAIEDASIKILPYEQNDSLEMRVCWRIPIFGFGSIYPDWYVFADILSGDIITYWTLFIC